MMAEEEKKKMFVCIGTESTGKIGTRNQFIWLAIDHKDVYHCILRELNKPKSEHRKTKLNGF